MIALVQGVVDEINERFATVEQVRSFRLLPKLLDHEDGELTATQKVKRTAVADRVRRPRRVHVRRGCQVNEFVATVVRGLGNGSIYALLALGFVIVYKSMRVISFAQPAFMMAGALLVSYLGAVDELLPRRPGRAGC